ncbi:MAG: GntR family transcriptional regulator [Lachnospiraceae bacterium]|nr:GntR family transcriptional regulator [Lachnospiraceae bacterium]
MSLDKDSRQPLYRQLMEELKEQIHNGIYKVGDQIPTEPELANQYEISRITVRKTIKELCEQGYLVKQQGKGTFVETPKIYRKIEQQSNVSFTESCKQNGRVPLSHVLSFEIIKAEEWVQDFLKLDSETKVLLITRLLLADNIPIIMENIYLPYDRFEDFQPDKLENSSLFEYLDKKYHIITHSKSRSTIEIDTASQEVASKLGIVTGEPVMLMCNYMKDQDEVPTYISREIIIGNRYIVSI